MTRIEFRGRRYDVGKGESVLDVLLRAEQDVPHSCKKGVCQACIMQSLRGEVPAETQTDLKETYRLRNYFLACQWQPSNDVQIALPDDSELYGRAIVDSVAKLNEGVCRVRMTPAADFDYYAGQFINIRRADGLVRSYSLASVPSLDRHLELHVKRLQNGKMSTWIHDEVKIGDVIEFQGPNGGCFYAPGRADQDILLIGTGTGLAPLWGIVRDALAHDHSGKIALYHGVRDRGEVYLTEELRCIADRHCNFEFVQTLSAQRCRPHYGFGRADERAFVDHPELQGWRIFLCGAPSMVHAARKRAFLAGAYLKQIFADPFELSDLRRLPRP